MYGFRRVPKESITLEVAVGIDGQGKPQYDSPIDLEGRVVRRADVIRGHTGTEVKTVATIWIDAGQDPLPNYDDRVTIGEGLVGIVVERIEGKALRSALALDHIRIQLREE